VASVAVLEAGKTGVDGLFGLIDGLGDGYALAERQTVHLDDNRCADLADIVDGIAGIVESAVAGGRDAHGIAQDLGECLGAFELACIATRTETGDAGVADVVAKPRDHLRVGSDDNELDVLA